MSSASNVIRIKGTRRPIFASDDAPSGGFSDGLPPAVSNWLDSLGPEAKKAILAIVKQAKDAPPGALSEREKAKCKARGVDPAKYAAMKARMGGR